MLEDFLGRKNVSVARANSGADVFRLAGFLGDDNLIRHEVPFGGLDSTALYREPIVNITIYQGAFWTRQSSEGKATFAADLAVSAHLRVSGRSGVNQHRGTPELRRHRALLIAYRVTFRMGS
jgi:hypothetical protein